MMNFLRKHMRKIFVITILAFIGGIFMGFGAYLFGPSDDEYKTAATVNKTKIPLKIFDSIYRNTLSMYGSASEEPITEEMEKNIKITTIQALVQDEIFYQQSLLYGIVVSDAELRNDIQSSAIFKTGANFDPRIYHAFLNSLHMTPKEYESLRKKQIAAEKLKYLLASSIKVWDYEFEEAKKEYPDISRDNMLHVKANSLLNEWYSDIVENSEIVSNKHILD